MSQAIENIKDEILTKYPKFGANGRVIYDIWDFKEQNITDTKKNNFYIRTYDLFSADKYKVKDSTKRDKDIATLTSTWAAVFQLDKDTDNINAVMNFFLGILRNYNRCVNIISFTDNEQNVLIHEQVAMDKQPQGKIDYPFHLLLVKFNLEEETTFIQKLSEACDNC